MLGSYRLMPQGEQGVFSPEPARFFQRSASGVNKMRRMLLWILMPLALAACSSGSTNSSGGLELAGQWNGSLRFNVAGTSNTFVLSLRHIENTTTLDGVFSFNSYVGDCFSSGPVTGNLVGSRIQLTLVGQSIKEVPVAGGTPITVSQTVTTTLVGKTTNSTMSGTFTVAGGPCSSQSGSWQAHR